jgi:formylglycine-generating enzyme required for sulfatase activity
MMAISRDPVTVGEYKEMVEDVLRTQGPEEAEKLIPRVLRAGQVWRRDATPPENGILSRIRRLFQGTRGLLARVGRSLLPAGSQSADKGYQLFWKIQDHGRLRGASRYELTDPSTHLDPNDDPIFLDQPVSFITYHMAESYLRWRSLKDGVAYRLPEIDELEAISRNFFPWNFPWGNILDPTLTISRQVFADKTMTFPQRVGTHPLGREFDRDYTVFGTRGHLGNVRELSQTPGEKGTVSVFGGSVGVVPGPFYYPSSRNSWPLNTPLAAGDAFRLVQDFRRPPGEK